MLVVCCYHLVVPFTCETLFLQEAPAPAPVKVVVAIKDKSLTLAPTESEFEFSDMAAMTCLLCARQFKTLDQLKRHNKESDLHKVSIYMRIAMRST